jgi:hypothetical protein
MNSYSPRIFLRCRVVQQTVALDSYVTKTVFFSMVKLGREFNSHLYSNLT